MLLAISHHHYYSKADILLKYYPPVFSYIYSYEAVLFALLFPTEYSLTFPDYFIILVF